MTIVPGTRLVRYEIVASIGVPLTIAIGSRPAPSTP